jgi:hypothetical protein
MHDRMVGDLGITRVRLEVGPQVEMENDDGNPDTIRAGAFRFAWQDDQVKRHVAPIFERVRAAGGRPVLQVSFDLRSRMTPAFLLGPEEYAEMASAFLGHLKRSHGLEADWWSVLNEPGNDRPGDPDLHARLTAATGRRLARDGFRTRMSGPECVRVDEVPRYLDALERVPGALDRFGQITYHLYHGSADDAAARRAVRERARKWKVTAAQTEWMEARDLAVARHVHLCLTEADATVWDRFGADLLFALPYAALLDPKSDDLVPDLSSTAWHLRQFSRWIRPGAVRAGLEGGTDAVRGVAFLPPGGGRPVVVLLNLAGTASAAVLEGLPAGRYGASHTSVPEGALGRALPAVETGEGGPVALVLAPRSVTTIHP